MSYIYQASDGNNQNKPVGSPTNDVTRGVLFEGELPHNAKVTANKLALASGLSNRILSCYRCSMKRDRIKKKKKGNWNTLGLPQCPRYSKWWIQSSSILTPSLLFFFCVSFSFLFCQVFLFTTCTFEREKKGVWGKLKGVFNTSLSGVTLVCLLTEAFPGSSLIPGPQYTNPNEAAAWAPFGLGPV